MPKYKIFETDQYLHNLLEISENIQNKISKKISNYVYKQLSENPYYGNNIKKLRNYSPETWRYRIGNFRMFYEIDEKEKIVFIVAIDLRKDAY
ncbi:MAG: type II toxin-antitoxin system RelE/ParE family toxin [Spirochaetales bacterium]|nr:type II toxin-antitoxin system RelE/ParE family toxin [Spirochaetales bacterium]